MGILSEISSEKMPRNWYEWSKSVDLKSINKTPLIVEETEIESENNFNKTDIFLAIHRIRNQNDASFISTSLNQNLFSSNPYNLKDKRTNSLDSEESSSSCSKSDHSRGRLDSVDSLQEYENGLNCWYDNIKASPELLNSCDSSSRSSSISSSVFPTLSLSNKDAEDSYLNVEFEKSFTISDEEEIKATFLNWFHLIDNKYGEPFLGLDAVENSPINPRIAVRIDPYHGFESRNVKKYEWDGSFDEEGKMHGRGIVVFEDGGESYGTWVHGVRNGKGTTSCPSKNIKLMVGEFKNSKLNGQGRIVYNDEKTLECHFRDGCLHGLARLLCPRKKLLWVGRYRNGMAHGVCWKLNPGGGYITGEVDSEGELSGTNICYIYPDFKTCYHGIFKEAIMVQARLSSVKSVRIFKGILEIEASEGFGPYQKHEQSSRNWICSNLLQRDPYEDQKIKVMASGLEMAGEGVFAKTDLPSETIVAFYNGVRIPPDVGDDDDDWEDCSYRIFLEIDEDATDIDCEDCERMDLPKELRSLDKYCATLGHKINHSFEPNCRFGKFLHPVYGPIPSVVTTQFIPEGRELFTYYKYLLNDCPQWYSDLWESK